MFKKVEKASCTFLRSTQFSGMQIRQKTARFKPKIAKYMPAKTPTALALDHFDFYYAPLFGKLWPSIRLGLLCPHKYIAVVNSFSVSSDASEEILNERGAFNLIKKVEEKAGVLRFQKKNVQNTRKAHVESISPNQRDAESTIIEDDYERRDESSLYSFQPSNITFSLGDIQSGKLNRPVRDIVITGFEGADNEIPKKSEVITYPDNLKLYVFPRRELADFPSPDRDTLGVPTWWLLDGGSVIPVLALNLKRNDTLLDMCAAPGGKSLLAAQTLLLDRLVCNDAKISRLGQLRGALASFIPTNVGFADRVILKKKDAADLIAWDELEAYDKVLVDAPCTTDRLSANVDDNNIFSTAMTTERLNLPQLQTKLLINALRSVRNGGSVVYSTCSLSPVQNEIVVENAVSIASDKFNIEAVELSLPQLVDDLRRLGIYRFRNCRRGFFVLPYLPSNFGPMYICKLQRIK